MFHHCLLGQGCIWDTQRWIALSSQFLLTSESQPTETVHSKAALNYSMTQDPAGTLVHCCLKWSDLHFNHSYIYFPPGLSSSGPGFLLAGNSEVTGNRALTVICECVYALKQLRISPVEPWVRKAWEIFIPWFKASSQIWLVWKPLTIEIIVGSQSQPWIMDCFPDHAKKAAVYWGSGRSGITMVRIMVEFTLKWRMPVCMLLRV